MGCWKIFKIASKIYTFDLKNNEKYKLKFDYNIRIRE